MTLEDVKGKIDAIISLFRSEAGLYWDELGEEQQKEVKGQLVYILMCDRMVRRDEVRLACGNTGCDDVCACGCEASAPCGRKDCPHE